MSWRQGGILQWHGLELSVGVAALAALSDRDSASDDDDDDDTEDVCAVCTLWSWDKECGICC